MFHKSYKDTRTGFVDLLPEIPVVPVKKRHIGSEVAHRRCGVVLQKSGKHLPYAGQGPAACQSGRTVQIERDKNELLFQFYTIYPRGIVSLLMCLVEPIVSMRQMLRIGQKRRKYSGFPLPELFFLFTDLLPLFDPGSHWIT